MTVPAPFTRTGVTFPGQLPTDPPAWDVRPHRMWLGKPGLMLQLPSADPANYTVPQSRNDVEQGLSGGGAGVTRFRNATSRWTISWQRLAGPDRSRIDAFYRGVYGPGPYCWVPPEDRNRLTVTQSLCGAWNGFTEGWAATTGTVTYDPTQTAAIAPCGALRWAGAGNNARLVAGDGTPGSLVPPPLYAAPYLPAEPVTGWLWAWTSTGSTAVQLAVAGRATDGTLTTATTASATLTTTPQRVTVTAPPGGLGAAAYVVLELVTPTGSTGDILISNPAMDYRDAPDDDWWLGNGVPRVHVAPDGRLTRSFDIHMNEPATITLVDAVAGRA